MLRNGRRAECDPHRLHAAIGPHRFKGLLQTMDEAFQLPGQLVSDIPENLDLGFHPIVVLAGVPFDLSSFGILPTPFVAMAAMIQQSFVAALFVDPYAQAPPSFPVRVKQAEFNAQLDDGPLIHDAAVHPAIRITKVLASDNFPGEGQFTISPSSWKGRSRA